MEEEELTLDIHIISRLTHIFYADELRKLGISMGQFPFIMGIFNNSGISQEELSAKLRISKSTTAVIIGQLIAGGVAERSADPADRRKFRLTLTARGLSLIPPIRQTIQRCHEVITTGFSDAEKKRMETLLHRARKNAEEHFC